MKWLAIGPALLLLAAVSLAAWVRAFDLPAARYHAAVEGMAVGDHPSEGGFAAVRDVRDPAAALAALDQVARKAPRTRPLAGSLAEGHVSYVTRSRVFGFPDITNVWIRDGRIHVSAHLVVGRGDMGVNRRRVESWMASARIA